MAEAQPDTHAPDAKESAQYLPPPSSLPSCCGGTRLRVHTAAEHHDNNTKAPADSPRKRLRPGTTCPCVAPSTHECPTRARPGRRSALHALAHSLLLFRPSGRSTTSLNTRPPLAASFASRKEGNPQQPHTGGCNKQCLGTRELSRLPQNSPGATPSPHSLLPSHIPPLSHTATTTHAHTTRVTADKNTPQTPKPHQRQHAQMRG
jgi:cell division septation protein DedD